MLYVTFMCFNDCKIKFECRQYALHFVRVKTLFKLTRLGIHFCALLLRILNTELKFEICLCFVS